MNLDKILRRIRLLFKEQYIYQKNDLITHIRHLKNYPFDKFWSIVISQTSIFQNHLHDLILKRKTEKDDFPIADRLKSQWMIDL